jgi:hypothetical protein
VKFVTDEKTPAEDEVTRLHGMEVQETSLVDKGANRRVFVVVKSKSGGDAMATDAKPANDDKDKDKKPKPAFPGAAPPFKAAGQKPEDAVDETDEEKEKRERAEAAAKKGDVAGAGETPAAVSPSAEVPPVAPVPAAAPIEQVAKAGQKMKKERLARLKEMHGSLGKLIAELEPEVEEPEGPCAGVAAKGAEPAPTPTRTDPAPVPVVPTAPDPVMAVVKEVAASVAKMTGVVEEQQKDLDRLLKRAPAPSSATVEGARQPAEKRQDEDRYPWPPDMNDARFDPQRAPKEASFFDGARRTQ